MRAGRVRSTVITAAFSSTTAIQPAVAVLVKAFRCAPRRHAWLTWLTDVRFWRLASFPAARAGRAWS
jgi:hypothetical protein